MKIDLNKRYGATTVYLKDDKPKDESKEEMRKRAEKHFRKGEKWVKKYDQSNFTSFSFTINCL